MTDGVTPKELAARLGVHPITVSRWCKDGRLRSTPCGRTFIIPLDVAEAFADAYIALNAPTSDAPVRYRVPNRRITPGTKRQGLYLSAEADVLQVVDEERRLEGEPISRSDFIEAAIGHYVNARRRERAAKMKVAS